VNTCPDCGHANIDGADLCEGCLQPLADPDHHSEFESCLLEHRIGALSPRAPVLVDAATPLREVLQALAGAGTGCVLVTADGAPVGIFSERDALLRVGAEHRALAGRPVREFMTPGPQTLEIDDPIAYALHRMDAGGYRHVPVTAGGRIAGVISIRDILRYLTENLADRDTASPGCARRPGAPA